MARLNNNDIDWILSIHPDAIQLIGVYHLEVGTLNESVTSELPGHTFDDPAFRMTHIFKKMQEEIRQKLTRRLNDYTISQWSKGRTHV